MDKNKRNSESGFKFLSKKRQNTYQRRLSGYHNILSVSAHHRCIRIYKIFLILVIKKRKNHRHDLRLNHSHTWGRLFRFKKLLFAYIIELRGDYMFKVRQTE